MRPKYFTTIAEREIIRKGGPAAVVVAEQAIKRAQLASHPEEKEMKHIIDKLLREPGHNPDIYARAREIVGR